ncbi:MAG: 16S rRNA (uracil(1498)-N(3))-methyltransferase [Deltaproteobacteria bacterium]|nr:16S rRNA (uracil(1498)-N(3))-methyltransferase [Deltaproteobacteria bacterium]
MRGSHSARVRLYLAPERWARRVGLEQEERHRLVDVLRLEPGAGLEVFDGRGMRCSAQLDRDAAGWCARLDPANAEREERRGPRVVLGVALLKGRKLDEVVRRVTEIGVAELRPFLCARSVARPDGRRQRERVERWRLIATEAARQSGRAELPKLCQPCSLDVLLAELAAREGLERRILLDAGAREGVRLIDRLGASDTGRAVLVGPEGGFAPAEIEAADRLGFERAGLGPNVLRSETAAVVAAAFACLDTGWRVE